MLRPAEPVDRGGVSSVRLRARGRVACGGSARSLLGLRPTPRLRDGFFLCGRLLLKLRGQPLGGGRRLLVPCDLGRDVALRLEGRVQRRLLLDLLRLGGGAELGEPSLEGRQLVAAGREHRLFVSGDGPGVGEAAAAVRQRGSSRLELGADGPDVLGQDRVLVGDGHEVADLGGGILERVGREEDLEQRGLAPLVRRSQVLLEQRLAVEEVGGPAVDVVGDRDELDVERVDLRAEVGEVGLDRDHLRAHVGEERADAVELRRHGLELGARDVELPVKLGRSAPELAQLDALSLQGSRQCLLRRLSVCELRTGFRKLGCGISGKGRAAGLSCDGAPSNRHEGDERDGETRSPPHRAVIRLSNVPFAP